MPKPPKVLTTCPNQKPPLPSNEDLDPRDPNWAEISIYIRRLDDAYQGCHETLAELNTWIREIRAIINAEAGGLTLDEKK